MAGNDRRKQMANQEHLELLKQGTAVWNEWRKHHLEIQPDLSEADLYGANLSRANLNDANLNDANLIKADLSRADLSFATFVRTNLKGTTLTGCRTYGISAWNVELTGALQDSLVITPPDEPIITVDNLKMAQFIYLLLNNQEIRDVIDTIAKKAVLILGRFTRERKAMLDALRDELRRHGYLPILFDFKKPSRRDLTETVSTLAHLSRFIVADLTETSSTVLKPAPPASPSRSNECQRRKALTVPMRTLKSTK